MNKITKTIITSGIATAAVVSVGLNIFQAQSAEGANQSYRALNAKYEKLDGKLKAAQSGADKVYNSEHIARARQFAILDELSQTAPDAFTTASNNAQKRTDKNLVYTLDHVGTLYPESTKKSTQESQSSAIPATEKSTSNVQLSSTQTESTTADDVDATPSTVKVPEYKTNGNSMTADEYKKVLTQAGFTDIFLSPRETLNVPSGYVFGVYPNEGAIVDPTNQIVIEVTNTKGQ